MKKARISFVSIVTLCVCMTRDSCSLILNKNNKRLTFLCLDDLLEPLLLTDKLLQRSLTQHWTYEIQKKYNSQLKNDNFCKFLLKELSQLKDLVGLLVVLF